MQGKRGRDVFPLPISRRDPGSSQFLLPGESVVYRSEVLGGVLALDYRIVVARFVARREGVGDCEQPVFSTVLVSWLVTG